jgi:hypothetical protein
MPRRRHPIVTRKSEYQLEYERMVPLVKARSRGMCEIREAHDCDGVATDHPHHRKRRGQGGSNTMTNLLDVCFTGHHWIHFRLPREDAEEFGLLIPSTDPETMYRWFD